MAQLDLTAAQGHLLLYLGRRRDGPPPCPRDLEQDLQLSHATIAGLLDRLGKKGFVAIRRDPRDRRCRRVELLPKGWDCIAEINRAVQRVEGQMLRDFTPSEEEQFAAFLNRAICNMGGNPCNFSNKEEEIQT